MPRFLIYDTETTGFPQPDKPMEHQPFVLQLSAILAEGERAETEVAELNRLLAWPNLKVPKDATKVHGITTAKLAKLGQPPLGVVKEFDELVRQADVVCAFNLSFDEAVTLTAYTRVGGTGQAFKRSRKACLMQSARKLCELPRLTEATPDQLKRWPVDSPLRFKAPSLQEAVDVLTDGKIRQGETHDALHDSRLALEVLRALLARNARLFYEPYTPKPAIRDLDLDRLVRILDTAEAEPGDSSLSQWEQDFLDDWREKRERYAENLFPPTDRQWKVLERIESKLGI